MGRSARGASGMRGGRCGGGGSRSVGGRRPRPSGARSRADDCVEGVATPRRPAARRARALVLRLLLGDVAARFRTWRRAAAAGAATRAFELAWLEATAVACWRALREAARMGRQEDARLAEAEVRLAARLRDDGAARGKARVALDRWRLRNATAALNAGELRARPPTPAGQGRRARCAQCLRGARAQVEGGHVARAAAVRGAERVYPAASRGASGSSSARPPAARWRRRAC